MRKLYTIGFFLFECLFLSAQSNLDSLWHTSFAMNDDTLKVRALIILSQKYEKQSADTSSLLAKKALALAVQIGNERQEYFCLRNGRNIFHAQAKLEEAKKWGKEALPLSEKYDTFEEQGFLMNDLGLSYWRSGQLDTALYYFQKGEKHFLEIGQGNWQIYSSIGRLYKKKGDLDKGVSYLTKALNIVEKADSRMDAGYVMYLLGELYLMQSDFENFGIITDKWQAFKEAHPSTLRFDDNAAHIQSISLFFENIQDRKSKLKEGIAYELRVGNLYRAGNYQLTYGQILIKENRLEEAMSMLLAAYKSQSKTSYIQERKETLFALVEVSKKLKKPEETLIWLEKYHIISDSLQKKEMLGNISELEIKYETEKNEQALILKSLEAKRATLERNLLLAGLATFGLFTFGFFNSYRKRIETKRRLAEQKAQLQTEKIDRLEREQQVVSLNAMVDGQEKERQRIANDLHDSLGGLLTSVKLHFNAIKLNDQKQPVYQKTNDLIDDACVEVRRISHNMMPRALAFSGLSSAIEDLVQGLSEKGIDCELEVSSFTVELTSTTKVMLYRIVQELINNIIKHAEATHLFIQLYQNDNQLTLMVEDDGKGFDIKKAFHKNGLGLSSIETRVRFLKGTIHWDSVPGEGTTVNINVPL